ncbi:hypothetical protein BXZ70DRAFT_179180 [Cristinia sonorae]|uniref:Uncharacterized protein n=1 Tax=Cristinia sonorae TaxID=1940300 RepID=A0A8K0UP44_9AGAR|nr:hypothetical protein BXZ70DRAFT_179180 [Cristinia sonorae]
MSRFKQDIDAGADGSGGDNIGIRTTISPAELLLPSSDARGFTHLDVDDQALAAIVQKVEDGGLRNIMIRTSTAGRAGSYGVFYIAADTKSGVDEGSQDQSDTHEKKSKTIQVTQINDPPCTVCSRRGTSCASTSGSKSMRCDYCYQSHRTCSLYPSRKRKAPSTPSEYATAESEPTGSQRKKVRSKSCVRPSSVSPEPSQTGLEYPVAAQEEEGPRGDPHVEPAASMVGQSRRGSEEAHMSEVENLRHAREEFFRELEELRREHRELIGGSLSHSYRNLYIKAKAWSAEEDLCLQVVAGSCG